MQFPILSIYTLKNLHFVFSEANSAHNHEHRGIDVNKQKGTDVHKDKMTEWKKDAVIEVTEHKIAEVNNTIWAAR